MKGTLVIQVLNTTSSFLRNRSKPATGVPDTIQFWVTADAAWRVRTYALDHDIHVYQLGRQQIPGEPAEWLAQNSRENFGDDIAAEHALQFENVQNQQEVQQVLAAAGLEPRLEVAEIGFCFWKPDDEKYVTQSTPKWA
jgi:hypothetical protein